jgi:hypothetical protein
MPGPYKNGVKSERPEEPLRADRAVGRQLARFVSVPAAVLTQLTPAARAFLHDRLHGVHQLARPREIVVEHQDFTPVTGWSECRLSADIRRPVEATDALRAQQPA